MTLSVNDVNTLKVDVYENAIAKAEKQLTGIRSGMRSEGGAELNYYAAELLQVILCLRQAME